MDMEGMEMTSSHTFLKKAGILLKTQISSEKLDSKLTFGCLINKCYLKFSVNNLEGYLHLACDTTFTCVIYLI